MMSDKEHSNELTTDSIPDAPRDDIHGTFEENEVNTKTPEASATKSRASKKPKKSKKPSNCEPSAPHPTGSSNTTFHISNSKNFHLGNVVNIHVGSGADRKGNKEKVKVKTAAVNALCCCNEMVTLEDLDIVSDHVGHNWKELGKLLGFTQGQLEQLYKEHKPKGFREVIYQMLLDWKQHKDTEATVRILCDSLWHTKQYDAAEYWAAQK